MQKVQAYKRIVTPLLGLRLRTEPDTSAPKLMTLPKGTIVWVWEEDVSRADQKDGHLWARVGVSPNDNPNLKALKGTSVAGYIALFEMVPFTKRA